VYRVDRHEPRVPEVRGVGEQSHHIVVLRVVIDTRQSDRIGRARVCKRDERTKAGEEDNDKIVLQAATRAVAMVDEDCGPSYRDPIKEHGCLRAGLDPKHFPTLGLPQRHVKPDLERLKYLLKIARSRPAG
jgi:hypothetical protein